MALEITEGFFGKVRLDGLRVAGAYRWPGPVHEGNGTWWSVIDRRASEEQTEALFTILGGQEQNLRKDAGLEIDDRIKLAQAIAHEPEPLFADIDFEFDLAGRRGRFFVKNVLDATVAPIRNPVTGQEHFISIHPHRGFEFREAEMASATFWSKGELEQQHEGRFAALTFASYGPNGIIPEESLPHRGE